MGNLERIKRLERLYAVGESPQSPDLEQRRAELQASLGCAREQAEREAAAGDSRRLHTLEDLERHMQGRVEQGHQDEP